MDAEEYQDGGESRFGREGWKDRDEDEEDQEDEHEEEEDEPLATTPKSKRPRLELPHGGLLQWEGKKKCVRCFNNSDSHPPFVCESQVWKGRAFGGCTQCHDDEVDCLWFSEVGQTQIPVFPGNKGNKDVKLVPSTKAKDIGSSRPSASSSTKASSTKTSSTKLKQIDFSSKPSSSWNNIDSWKQSSGSSRLTTKHLGSWRPTPSRPTPDCYRDIKPPIPSSPLPLTPSRSGTPMLPIPGSPLPPIPSRSRTSTTSSAVGTSDEGLRGRGPTDMYRRTVARNMGNAALLRADLLGHSPPVAGARTGAGAWAGGIPSDRYTAWVLDIESRILQVRILQVFENNPPPLDD